MADNTLLNAGSGGDTIRDVAKGAGVKTPVCILDVGAGASESLLAAGQAAMAASLPVAIASNQSAVPVSAASLPLPAGAASDATVGPVTEAAPASDTASSGLNGRLQRIAQRLSSLIALLPSALTGSGNLKIAVVESTVTQPVSQAAATSGGATPYHLVSAASTNATSVKGSAGQLYGVQVFNTNAAARYLKFYDKAIAPTVGTDAPVKTILVPGGSAGAGVVASFGAIGVAFAAGIALAITTGAADADVGAVGAVDVIVSLDFK